MKSTTWFCSRSGIIWDVGEPKPEMIIWDDVAESLAKTCRWGGHCKGFYSVAQHSVFVADELPEELRIYGLLHDAHESFTGDLIRPLKGMLGNTMREIEDRIDLAIFTAAGLPLPDAKIKRAVKDADLCALATERRDIVNVRFSGPWELIERVKPSPKTIQPVRWETAMIMMQRGFMHEFKRHGLMEAMA